MSSNSSLSAISSSLAALPRVQISALRASSGRCASSSQRGDSGRNTCVPELHQYSHMYPFPRGLLDVMGLCDTVVSRSSPAVLPRDQLRFKAASSPRDSSSSQHEDSCTSTCVPNLLQLHAYLMQETSVFLVSSLSGLSTSSAACYMPWCVLPHIVVSQESVTETLSAAHVLASS